MTEIKLNNVNRDDVIYYETGFEQYHPYPHIIQWIRDAGYEYHEDWKCIKVPHSFNERSYYKLEFATDEMASNFALKWL